MNDTPKGYNCAKCGKWHAFPAYVFAHWKEPLKHKCDVCSVRHTIHKGIATLIKGSVK